MNVMVARNKLPPRTVGDLLESLSRLTSRFVEAVRALLVAHDEALSGDAVPAESLFPELTDEQIDALPPEMGEAYRGLREMDPSERARFIGHTRLANAAWAFLTPVCVDGDVGGGVAVPDEQQLHIR